MEETQLATIVDITERMLPDARNVYMVTEPRKILEISAQLREDLRHLRRLVNDAQAKVRAAQDRQTSHQAPSVAEAPLPSIASQTVRGMLPLPDPLSAAASGGASPASTASSSSLYPYALPPYPPSMHAPSAEPTGSIFNQHHHLYPLALAMQNISGASDIPTMPQPLASVASTSSASPAPGDKPGNDIIIIDD